VPSNRPRLTKSPKNRAISHKRHPPQIKLHFNLLSDENSLSTTTIRTSSPLTSTARWSSPSGPATSSWSSVRWMTTASSWGNSTEGEVWFLQTFSRTYPLQPTSELQSQSTWRQKTTCRLMVVCRLSTFHRISVTMATVL
jgi:hypothetical protein